MFSGARADWKDTRTVQCRWIEVLRLGTGLELEQGSDLARVCGSSTGLQVLDNKANKFYLTGMCHLLLPVPSSLLVVAVLDPPEAYSHFLAGSRAIASALSTIYYAKDGPSRDDASATLRG